jgi:hypothetical protein
MSLSIPCTRTDHPDQDARVQYALNFAVCLFSNGALTADALVALEDHEGILTATWKNDLAHRR